MVEGTSHPSTPSEAPAWNSLEKSPPPPRPHPPPAQVIFYFPWLANKLTLHSREKEGGKGRKREEDLLETCCLRRWRIAAGWGRGGGGEMKINDWGRGGVRIEG